MKKTKNKLLIVLSTLFALFLALFGFTLLNTFGTVKADSETELPVFEVEKELNAGNINYFSGMSGFKLKVFDSMPGDFEGFFSVFHYNGRNYGARYNRSDPDRIEFDTTSGDNIYEIESDYDFTSFVLVTDYDIIFDFGLEDGFRYDVFNWVFCLPDIVVDRTEVDMGNLENPVQLDLNVPLAGKVIDFPVSKIDNIQCFSMLGTDVYLYIDDFVTLAFQGTNFAILQSEKYLSEDNEERMKVYIPKGVFEVNLFHLGSSSLRTFTFDEYSFLDSGPIEMYPLNDYLVYDLKIVEEPSGDINPLPDVEKPVDKFEELGNDISEFVESTFGFAVSGTVLLVVIAIVIALLVRRRR